MCLSFVIEYFSLKFLIWYGLHYVYFLVIPYMVCCVSLFDSIETAALRLIARASTTDLHIQILQYSNDPKQVTANVFQCI